MGNAQGGNQQETELLRTAGTLFVQSVENSYVTIQMVNEMITRWQEIGKPLFLTPKDFKERILTSAADTEIKLNYLKWLQQGLEIDMFEIQSILILYARASLDDRLILLFKLFCFDGEETMQMDELKFMIDKFGTSICSTLQIKKTLLLEIVKQTEGRFQFNIDRISRDEFVNFMQLVFVELSRTLQDVTEKINILSNCAKNTMLPQFLQPGQTLLGKFFIQNVIPFREIFDEDLLSKSKSVFSDVKPLLLNQGTTNSNQRTLRQRTAKIPDSNSSYRDQAINSENSKLNESGSFQMMSYLTLLKTNYSFRLKTLALFEQGQPTVCFDIFIVENDVRFREFRLFENLWRETLLLHHLRTYPDKVQPVVNFGQLPQNIIYREIKEISGITLDLYIRKQFALLMKPIIKKELEKSEPTVFTEVGAIDLILKVINLVQILHDQTLIHSNLCPQEIFLKDAIIDHMCFLNLYHTCWNPQKVLKIDLPNMQETTIKFETRTRNSEYLSPEQAKIGRELQDIANLHNGKIDQVSAEVNELFATNQGKITEACDIYSIGAILYCLLLGKPPENSVAQKISQENMHNDSPENNVYKIPYFLQNKIVSNEMADILVKLLHQDPDKRYEKLVSVKQDLLKLRKNIFETPLLMRQVLRHPILPEEVLDSNIEKFQNVDFRSMKNNQGPNYSQEVINRFSLKYLAKFVNEHDIKTVSIHGGEIPMREIRLNRLVELNLREQGLYSEDLFILAQVLKINSSITTINLSKNMIGYTYMDERKVLEIKMKNQKKIKDATFDQLFYNSIGIEHFSIALSQTDRVKHIDLSENDIGKQNFLLLLDIFKSNSNIQTINVADCNIDGNCVSQMCGILKATNTKLQTLKFRNSDLSDVGAQAIAELLCNHMTLVELEIFNCGITEHGGNKIGNALKTNFCLEKLSIGENILNKRDVEQIQQSVIFNTQYNQMKDSNRKFEGFAHNLIAESLKRWANHSNFVADKLKERLGHPLDDLDQKIAEVMFDNQGQMDLKPVPQNYEYTSGEGKIKVEKKPKY